MKRYLFSFVITTIVFLFGNVTNFSQSDAENSVKNTMNKILEFSKSKSYEKAAVLIAYSGEDQSKHFKLVFDPTNKEDLNQIKRICKKISALIDISDSYKIDKIEPKKIDAIDGYKVIVSFISGSQKLETSFEFAQINSVYVLFNMN